MPGIQDFIKMAAQNLGESEESTRSATGALLGAIQDKVEPGDFQQLLGAIPGADALLGSADSGSRSGFLASLSSLFGGSGGTADLAASMQKSGFSAGNIGGLASLFLTFLKSNAGEGVVQKLLAKLPELAKLLPKAAGQG